MPLAAVNGIDLYYDEFGDPDDPALVLMAGFNAQLLNYPDEWCLAFVDRGLRVVRFDNRDAGLSTHLPSDAAYDLSDMAADVVGLLDHLGIDAAYVWGSSMGGMIAQVLAAGWPDRVAGLFSVQSTTGEPDVGLPDPDALAAIIEVASPAVDRSAAIDGAVRMAEILINNPANFDEESQRRKAELVYDRSYDPSAAGRQLAALIGATPRVDSLRSLTVPTIVVHGERDPLIGISGGRRTAELIPGAEFVEIEGMGHDLTAVFWSRFVDIVVSHVAAIESRSDR